MSTVTKEALIAAIYGQESSSGAADTSKANYAGAVGPMQIIPSTFDGLKNLGIIPKDYDITNPEHSKDAGEKLVGHLFDKFGGNPQKVAAAYYAGEKAVRKDGSIANFVDRKNPGAPSTHTYVSQIMGRLGEGDGSIKLPVSADGAEPTRASVLSSWDEGYGPRPKKLDKEVADHSAAPIQAAPPLHAAAPISAGLAGEEAALRAAEQKAQDTPVIDLVGKAFMQTTMVGSILRNNVMRDFNTAHGPEAGFTLDPKALAGYTSDEQEHIREANSNAQLSQIKWEIDQRREDLAAVNSKGTGMGIAIMIAAGLPEGYLSGMGAARALSIAKAGSRVLAAGGRRGAAMVSSLAENVGSNVAMTGVQDQFDPYVGATDYAFGVGFGLLGTVLSTPHIFGKQDKKAALSTLEGLKDSSAQQTVALRDKAIETLGPNASPEALQGELRRLEANQIRQEVSAATGALPPERRLLPDNEDLRADAEHAVSTPDQSLTNVREGLGRSSNPLWDDPMYLASRVERAVSDPKWDAGVRKVLDGEMGIAQTRELSSGVHVTEQAKKVVSIQPAIQAVRELAGKYLSGETVVIGGGATNKAANAEIISLGNVHVIGLTDNPVNPSGVMRSGMHELGHAVFHANAQYIPTELLNRMKTEHGEFLSLLRKQDPAAGERRLSITHEDAQVLEAGGKLGANEYNANFDEYMAEQFVKHIETKVAKGEGGFSKQLTDRVVAAVRAVMDFFLDAKARGYLKPDVSADEFFARVLAGTLKETKKVESEFLAPDLVFPSSFDRAADLVESPVAKRHGLDLMPVDTPQQKAEAQAITALYSKAETMAPKVDEKRLSSLMNTALFQGAQSTANTMLRSSNPVVRMIAAELLESPGGAGGRRSNASISKYMNEKAYLGNTLNEVQGHYKAYRDSQGGTIVGDFWDGKQWEHFNRLVAEEMESRLKGRAPVDSAPAVKAAADKLEEAYERMRVAQTTTKTIGWGALPESSKGYMPHRMSAEKIVNMTGEQARALQSALREQFIQIEGFDISFAENLSRKYIDRVKRRALGGFDAPAGVHQVGAADIVEDALQAMGMTQPEVQSMMGKYMRGAANHTKKRLSLDLSAEYPLGDGQSFKLLDLFETDQFKLLRSQANRVSGEVALARHGVMGKSGLKLLRRAMEFGGDGEHATAKEFEAFDQIAAEFMGDSFGTQSKMVDRVMQVNSLARLGGMGFTQFAESINGIFHVGAIRTLDSIGSMGRLRSEIKALARGEAVENPIIGSLEKFGGAEFGTEAYKTVFPFDNGSLQYQTYGKDTLNAADRLLRGGTFVQGKLSGWRAIHSVQQRGFSEQIVRKAADYIKNGGNDAALRDMGIGDELISRLRKDIDSIAQFDGDKLTNFDITKATDLQAADEFTQAIHRGVSQIIQGTFIGEQGAWAHSGMMRLMTQFRTFSLTSVEKQWARQRGNVGTAKALGYMLGAMSIAAPIYMARTYLASIGRSDQEAYLEKQLSAAQIARATLNYIAMSGVAGDFLDATTAMTGIGKVTGGRSAAGSDFVGNVVAPATGMVDDVWRGLQNTKEGTDPHDLIKTLPFSRHPLLIPAINALGK